MQLHLNQHLRGEGISRLLAFVIKAARDKGNVNIYIACPGWLQEPIKEYLLELDVKMDQKVKFISTGNTPILLRLYNYFSEKRKKKIRKKKSFKVLIKTIITSEFPLMLLQRILGIRNIGFAFILMLLGLPVFILFLFLYTIIKFINSIFRLLNRITLFKKIGIFFQDDLYGKIKANAFKNKFSALFFKLYQLMLDNEFNVLAKKANKTKKIDCWFIPHPGWAHSKKLKKPLVVAVPDLVYLEFPTKFNDEFSGLLHDRVKELINKAAATISYSEYVQKNHVIDKFQKDQAYVIRHAPIDTLEHLEKLICRTQLTYEELINRLISNYQKKLTKKIGNNNYISTISFEEIPYLFVSSQVRPHKNYLNLFKAFHILLRKKYRNLKLVITGSLNQELIEYIDENRLHLDIISVPHLPPRVHAAFYAKAFLTVAPTLFEGGFPFVFSESMSVNTPVMMSAIPVTVETVHGELAKKMLFDPYDINQIVEKIEWALDNTEELLTDQNLLYSEMKNRTWNDVGEEYISVFEKVCQPKV